MEGDMPVLETLESALNHAQAVAHDIKMALGTNTMPDEQQPRPSHGAELLDTIERLTDLSRLLAKDLEHIYELVRQAAKMLADNARPSK